MSDQPEAAPAGPASAPAATAGEALRTARERQGVRIEVLAASLKVSQRKLEWLESDRYDELPDATFTRALALSVCKVLKINPEPVLARLPVQGPRELQSVTMGLNAPFRDRGGRADAWSWRSLVNAQVGAAAVLVVAAAAVYWVPASFWPRWGSGEVTRVVSAPTSPAAAASVAVTPAAAGSAPAADGPMAVAPSASAASDVVDTVFSSPALPGSPSDGPVAGGMLMLRAAAESWIEVRDGAGHILLSRSLAPGEAAGLDGSLPLRLVVGNAEATQVTFRGQPVSLAGTRDNVARLELK